ncbi:MAG TPA: tetratricopeptide repeat protein, partial [Nitrospiria bacterium]
MRPPPSASFSKAIGLLGILVVLLPGCLSARGRPISPPPAPAEQQILIDEGLAVFRNNDWPEAVRRFQEIIARFPGSPLLAEAQWMLGRSHEAAGALN